MAYSKKKNPKNSKEVRLARLTMRALIVSRRAILTVIVVAMLVVILAVLAQNIITPEYTVKRKIEQIAKDYYENYYYEMMISTDAVRGEEGQSDVAQMMERYVEPGFAMVALRQLLLYDNQRHVEAEGILKKYCDEDATYIKIYPEAPFGRENYRVNYHYSCIF